MLPEEARRDGLVRFLDRLKLRFCSPAAFVNTSQLERSRCAADAFACSRRRHLRLRGSLVRREGGCSVNQLRQLMLEELRRRNFADTTIRSYLHGVEHFSRYFRRRPDQLGPEDIRKYQAMLFTELKFSPNTVILRLASLRFFYIHVLKRNWRLHPQFFSRRLPLKID